MALTIYGFSSLHFPARRCSLVRCELFHFGKPQYIVRILSLLVICPVFIFPLTSPQVLIEERSRARALEKGKFRREPV